MTRIFRDAVLLLLFWIACFDFHRIAFSIHHWGKLKEVGFGEWLLSFIYSFRLDLATGAALSALPFLVIVCFHLFKGKALLRLRNGIVYVLLAFLVAVNAGETVAYGEWNHKLTSRVFMHLSNPDEVVRTANYSMIFWYILYFIVEYTAGFFFFKWLIRQRDRHEVKNIREYLITVPLTFFILGLQFLALRGGWQQIPININAGTYSNKAVANDISINSLYFFGKSYLLYNRSTIDEFMPKVNKTMAENKVKQWYAYPKEHNNYFLANHRPNVVLVVLEGWSGEAIGCLGPNKGATPYFDRLAKEGLLFTRIYATGTTSEIGNSSIFSGNPAVPEVSISMQPEKHRKLHCLNEDMEAWGYHSSYIFSGDLKYGNIGGYFMDHGFDVVKDESNFPSDLPRGKLNFYDRDLYKFLIKEINQHGEPFLQCAFTGSTHAPYDQPKGKGKVWKGEESDYMNALVYSDECLGEFINKSKKYPWYKNTIFVFISDHGHACPTTVDPGNGKFYHIPLLIYGEPVKPEYRGKKMNMVGSQADLAATLIYQMKGDPSRYPWSKDLMNPQSPKFAFHSIIRGYGWQTETGNFAYHFDAKNIGDNTYSKNDLTRELKKCHLFLTALYEDYKKL